MCARSWDAHVGRLLPSARGPGVLVDRAPLGRSARSRSPRPPLLAARARQKLPAAPGVPASARAVDRRPPRPPPTPAAAPS